MFWRKVRVRIDLLYNFKSEPTTCMVNMENLKSILETLNELTRENMKVCKQLLLWNSFRLPIICWCTKLRLITTKEPFKRSSKSIWTISNHRGNPPNLYCRNEVSPTILIKNLIRDQLKQVQNNNAHIVTLPSSIDHHEKESNFVSLSWLF